MTESELHIMVADYLRLQYPDILFKSDYGAGIKLTAHQASIQKRQNGGTKGWPDIFIAKPKLSKNPKYDQLFTGLFIELKKDGTRLKKKNGEWANEHLTHQAKILGKLREAGYKAEFACGFDEAKEIIDNYLKGVI